MELHDLGRKTLSATQEMLQHVVGSCARCRANYVHLHWRHLAWKRRYAPTLIASRYPMDLTIHLNLMADGHRLPERIRLTLFRIYQHAVSSVVRHAHAANLSIRFAIEEGQILLEI